MDSSNTLHKQGLVARDEMDVLRRLDALELSQSDFKLLIDARNNMLSVQGLAQLTETAHRQGRA